MMGRLHGAAQAHETLSAALAAGFAVSADFIFGLPHQSLENWARTLREAVRCGLSHISLYQLSLEEGTPWENLPREVLPDGYAQYRWAQWYLPRHGYEQYEIANFARAGRESRHNLNYWREGEYLGIGPGAASYINGARMKNSGLLREYAAALDAGRLPIRESERLDAEARGARSRGARAAHSRGHRARGVRARIRRGRAFARRAHNGRLSEKSIRIRRTRHPPHEERNARREPHLGRTCITRASAAPL